MQIIDVTLRDGGHVREFNWPIKFAQDHYKSLCKIPNIKYIELGYWKQTSKSKNTFYNLDFKKVEKNGIKYIPKTRSNSTVVTE